ncbi:MAG TPA: LysR family transcriptional regulator [Acetobacteraceae bacterium]|nr:LysR family transcriptional regulator [Acetobacteraceae bacterium]
MNAVYPVGSGDGRWPATATTALPTPARLPELRELRSFAVAARTGNLGRAARHLNITAAAVSQQLHKLEDTFATRLLIRHTRGVSPTAAGRDLLRRADAVLRLLEAPLNGSPLASAGAGIVSLALPAEYGPLLAPALLPAAQQQLPPVSLALTESGNDSLDDVCGGATDLALLQDPPRLNELAVERLLTEDLGVVCAPNHALAASAQPLRLRDLLDVPLILPSPEHWIRRLLAKTEAQRGLRFNTVTQADSAPVMLAMVRHRIGCTILPAAAVRAHAVAGTLVFRPIIQPSLAVTHAVAVHRDARDAVRGFAGQAAQAIRGAVLQGSWPGARLLRAATQPVLTESSVPRHPLRVLFRSPAVAEGD